MRSNKPPLSDDFDTQRHLGRPGTREGTHGDGSLMPVGNMQEQAFPPVLDVVQVGKHPALALATVLFWLLIRQVGPGERR